MRTAGRLKLGYYPLPRPEGHRLRELLQGDHAFSAIDPCAGTGDALHLVTEGMDCQRYGVELDADRAEGSASSGIQTIQGNLFDVHAKVESFSLLYLNPPYDCEIGSLDNQRMELLFLDHTHRWLAMGGVLVFVVPEKRIAMCSPLLAANFTDVKIFKLTDPESIRFGQVVITGARKTLRGDALEVNRIRLSRMLYRLPLLELDGTHEPYKLPTTGVASIVHKGLPVDTIEDAIPNSAAWKQAAPYLIPKEEMTSGRPITPLHAGHVGLLCTAGLLNGVFGKDSDRHIARWRSIKHSYTIHEKEDDLTIVRKRERFSNELVLLYEDGRTCVLTETPQKTESSPEEEPITIEFAA